jgi:TetR/AcrR family transcriptional regulator, transcriptional repressor for nem operon
MAPSTTSDHPTPTKGERTRRHIVETAAPVFNTRGYWATSMSDVLAAVDLGKGGLYNHFAGKDELALAALDHNVTLVGDGIRAALAPHRNAVDRLVAVVEYYRGFAHDPPLVGGCPTLNAATESAGTHPALRERSLHWLGRLLDETFARIVERGLERGELAPGTDPATVASVVFASVEGALMLNQVYDDPVHMDRVADHLVDYVRSLAA